MCNYLRQELCRPLPFLLLPQLRRDARGVKGERQLSTRVRTYVQLSRRSIKPEGL